MASVCRFFTCFTFQCHGQNHVHITIILCTIITACPRWQDDLMDLIRGWNPSFISKYMNMSVHVCVCVCPRMSYCMCICVHARWMKSQVATTLCAQCLCICSSLLSVRRCRSNVYMPRQEFSNILAAIFNQSPQLFVLSFSVPPRCMVRPSSTDWIIHAL